MGACHSQSLPVTGYCSYYCCVWGAQVGLQHQRVQLYRVVEVNLAAHGNRVANSLELCPSTKGKSRSVEPPNMEVEFHYRCCWCSGSYNSSGIVRPPVTWVESWRVVEAQMQPAGCKGFSTFAKAFTSCSCLHSIKYLLGIYCALVPVLSSKDTAMNKIPSKHVHSAGGESKQVHKEVIKCQGGISV